MIIYYIVQSNSFQPSLSVADLNMKYQNLFAVSECDSDFERSTPLLSGWIKLRLELVFVADVV